MTKKTVLSRPLVTTSKLTVLIIYCTCPLAYLGVIECITRPIVVVVLKQITFGFDTVFRRTATTVLVSQKNSKNLFGISMSIKKFQQFSKISKYLSLKIAQSMTTYRLHINPHRPKNGVFTKPNRY